MANAQKKTNVVDIYPGCGVSIHTEVIKGNDSGIMEYMRGFGVALGQIPKAISELTFSVQPANVQAPDVYVNIEDKKAPEVVIHNSAEVPAAQIYIKEENRFLKYLFIVSIISNLTDIILRLFK